MMSISDGSAQAIVHDEFGYSKVYVRWVTKQVKSADVLLRATEQASFRKR